MKQQRPDIDRAPGSSSPIGTMPYLQTRDLLVRVRSYHQRLRDWCARHEGSRGDPRVALLVDLIRRREDSMQGSMAKLVADADPSVLDTWLQFEPDAAERADLDAYELGDEFGIDEVLARATGFELAIQAIYARAAETLVAPRVRVFFSALADLHDARGKQLGRVSQGLEDGGLS